MSEREPIIDLPGGELLRLTYAGEELFTDANGNGVADAGDRFEGIVRFESIAGIRSGRNLNGRLAGVELTGHFRFSVLHGSSAGGHIEFGLGPDDFFRFYVNGLADGGFDPSAPDAVARATRGRLWYEVAGGAFFESVNDRGPDGLTLNRSWMNLARDDTGLDLQPGMLRTAVGRDANHEFGGALHGDHSVQMIFDNRTAGPSRLAPAYTFAIYGDMHLQTGPRG